MSDPERAKFKRRITPAAAVFGAAMGLLSSLSSEAVNHVWNPSIGFFDDFLLHLAIALVTGVLLVPFLSHRYRAILADTVYATSHGLKARDIRLYSFWES
jgi:ABC-type Fe3+-siderophore transport system permease subunit